MRFQFSFQFTHAISVYFSLLSVFFRKGTMRVKGELGNRGTSVGIKTLRGKWRTICAPIKSGVMDIRFEPEFDSGLIDEE